DVDLTHHTHTNLLRSCYGDVGKVSADLVKNLAHLLAVHATAFLEALNELVLPGLHHLVGVPLHHLIGAHLVGHVDDEVTVHHGVNHLADEGEGEAPAGVLLHTGEVY